MLPTDLPPSLKSDSACAAQYQHYKGRHLSKDSSDELLLDGEERE